MLRNVDPPAILYASPAIEQIFRITREELYRDPLLLQDLVHPDDREWLAERRDAMMRATDFEYRIIRPDGEVPGERGLAELEASYREAADALAAELAAIEPSAG